MPSATASLPSDPDALRAFATALQEALVAKERELAARDAEIHAKTLHIATCGGPEHWQPKRSTISTSRECSLPICGLA